MDARQENLVRYRLERHTLSQVDAIALDIGASRNDVLRVLTGIGLREFRRSLYSQSQEQQAA